VHTGGHRGHHGVSGRKTSSEFHAGRLHKSYVRSVLPHGRFLEDDRTHSDRTRRTDFLPVKQVRQPQDHQITVIGRPRRGRPGGCGCGGCTVQGGRRRTVGAKQRHVVGEHRREAVRVLRTAEEPTGGAGTSTVRAATVRAAKASAGTVHAHPAANPAAVLPTATASHTHVGPNAQKPCVRQPVVGVRRPQDEVHGSKWDLGSRGSTGSCAGSHSKCRGQETT